MINRTGLISRPVPYRDVKLYVIATEGQNTEKDYFGIFQTTRLHIAVLPTGSDDPGSEAAGQSDPKHVLERLREIKATYQLRDDDELWLMIDVDSWPKWVLVEVCREAKQQDHKLAVSNPCFELWLVLHFQDFDENDNNGQRLKQTLHKLGGSNQKNKLKLAAFKRQNIEDAVQRAEALDKNADESRPSFPGTHVYKIVKSLLARMTIDTLR